MFRRHTAALGTIAATFLLALPALWNGYPLIYSDTGTYLNSSFGLHAPLDRPPFYGAFLLATHGTLTLWTTVFVQAAALAATLRLLIETEIPERTPKAQSRVLLGVAAALSLLTAAPWFTSQLMPDALTASGVLGLFLLLRGRLPRGARTIFARGLFLLFLLVHLSHLTLGLTLVASMQLVSRLGTRFRFDGGFRAAWLCVAVALAGIPLFHLMRTGEAFYSKASHAFLLGRLWENGLVQKLLAERCPGAGYALCAHRDHAGGDGSWFMWDPESPLQQIGGLYGSRDEAMRIIRDSVLAHPLDHLAAAGRNTVRQLVTIDLGDGLAAQADATWVTRVIRRRFPHEWPQLASSRQQAGALWPDTRRLVPLHRVVLAASALFSAALLAVAMAGRRVPVAELHLIAWTALVVNAAIVSNLSTTVDRYQARLVWLLPLAVLITARSWYVQAGPARPHTWSAAH